MKQYHAITMPDDVPMVVRGLMGQECEDVGRALTRRDAELIAAELNRVSGGGTDLREKLLSEVADAIENCFEVGAS
jgi:hypothetical protein